MDRTNIEFVITAIAQAGAQRKPVPDNPKDAYYRGISDAIEYLYKLGMKAEQ